MVTSDRRHLGETLADNTDRTKSWNMELLIMIRFIIGLTRHRASVTKPYKGERRSKEKSGEQQEDMVDVERLWESLYIEQSQHVVSTPIPRHECLLLSSYNPQQPPRVFSFNCIISLCFVPSF